MTARRVVPPDLITPATASDGLRKVMSPDALPFESVREFFSWIEEKFVPEPDPYLKMRASWARWPRIESSPSTIELSTGTRKHADHCGRS